MKMFRISSINCQSYICFKLPSELRSNRVKMSVMALMSDGLPAGLFSFFVSFLFLCSTLSVCVYMLCLHYQCIR